ncbi:MAG: divalent-cation tolerance protein CutA [Nevskiales bacterium]
MNDHSLTLVVFCTCPDQNVAAQIARQLVADKLAACVNILPGISSVYEWQGEVCQDEEVQLIIKTTHQAFDSLSQAIVAAHPYELPEVIAVPVKAGLPAYLDWLNNNVKA